MSAYEEGREAFYRDEEITTNPYDDHDGQYDEWEDGYMEADIYESGEGH